MGAGDSITSSFLDGVSAKEFVPVVPEARYEFKTGCKAKNTPTLWLFTAESREEAPQRAELRLDSKPAECRCKQMAEIPTCWRGHFRLDKASFRDFLQAAVQPNTLLEANVVMDLTIEKDGRFRLVPGDVLVRVQLPSDFGPGPVVIEYGPIAGLTDAIMSPAGSDQVCFRDVASDIFANAKVYMGDQIAKAGYPIQTVDEDGTEVQAKCEARGLSFEARIGGSSETRVIRFDRL